MPPAIFPATIAVPRPSNTSFSQLGSVSFLSGPFPLFPNTLLSSTAGSGGGIRPPSLSPFIIRMGGGPRTYPGGVTKWQWKRMQANKAKQLLKARLLRERQLYDMRKRAELKAAVAELERPWEVVERAPNLFSVGADEQVKALADRFQRPGGLDLWNERDGPQVFPPPREEQLLPSTRFFPKGVVHSTKPYGVLDEEKDGEEPRFDDWIARGGGGARRRSRKALKPAEISDFNEPVYVEDKTFGDGSKQSEESVSLSNNFKNSKFLKNFKRQDDNDVGNQKDLLQESFPMNSGKKWETNFVESTERSRNRGNGRGQGSKTEFSSSKYSKAMNVARGTSYNGKARGSQSRFSSTMADEMASGKVETGKKVTNGRYTNGNERTKVERISLRPTTQLYYKEGGYREEYGVKDWKKMSRDHNN